MDYSDQEPCKLHLMEARGAERILSPQIPPLPGCRYGSHVPIDTERQVISIEPMQVKLKCNLATAREY